MKCIQFKLLHRPEKCHFAHVHVQAFVNERWHDIVLIQGNNGIGVESFFLHNSDCISLFGIFHLYKLLVIIIYLKYCCFCMTECACV